MKFAVSKRSRIVETSLVLVFVAFACSCAIGSVGVPESVSVAWASREYSADLPAPFGTTKVRIAEDATGETTDIRILFSNNEIIIPGTVLEEIQSIGEPEIGYEHDALRGDETIESFIVNFEFGPAYKVELTECIPQEAPCFEWVRDIVVFKIDSKGSISRRIVFLGETVGKP